MNVLSNFFLSQLLCFFFEYFQFFLLRRIFRSQIFTCLFIYLSKKNQFMSLRVSTLQKYDENIKISKLNNELRLIVYSFTLEQVFFSFGDFLYPLLGLRISFFSRFFVEYLFLILSSFYRFQSFTYL